VSPMAGRAKWILPLLLLVAIAGCGRFTPQPAAGQAASINLSLKTVPTVRSVTVSSAQGSFDNCQYGDPSQNTGSKPDQLGYPNGVCWLGLLNPFGVFPIKITNTGIASYLEVNGASATPSDNGNSWSLCNAGRRAAVRCNGTGGKPGTDQYLVANFGPSGRINATGLTDTPVCDRVFGASGNCWAVQGTYQTEGVRLTGPSTSTDTSTKWTVTIPWTPVPGLG
jgi:hypothetical protein